MSTKNADDDLSDLFKIFNNLNKGRIPEKISFLKNILFEARENALSDFDTTLDRTHRLTRSKTSRLNENFINEIVSNEKTNSEIFNEYYGYQSPPFLAEDLFKVNQVKNK